MIQSRHNPQPPTGIELELLYFLAPKKTATSKSALFAEYEKKSGIPDKGQGRTSSFTAHVRKMADAGWIDVDRAKGSDEYTVAISYDGKDALEQIEKERMKEHGKQRARIEERRRNERLNKAERDPF